MPAGAAPCRSGLHPRVPRYPVQVEVPKLHQSASGRRAIPPMNHQERRAAAGLAGIFALRMLGLFMILPVFALYAHDLAGATPLLVGLAIGAYGLTQALLQIPFGVLSDRIGRKSVIYVGLMLFALGSVVAAAAESIQWVIIGRALQGSGAVAAAITALAADLTRESVRTRAMAAIGVSVALSFAAALVLGPVLGNLMGVAGIFWLTGGLALLGMALLAGVVPSPASSAIHRDAQPVLVQLGGVLRDGQLLRLDTGVFLLHLTMVSLFVVLPLSLNDTGLAAARHWQLYLPVVLAAILLMVPFIIAAEQGARVRGVLLGSAAALLVALLGFALLHNSLWALALLLTVMFTVFNLLEAVLPSLVSKVASAGAKGTAMGVFSSAQFVGAFLGGLLGGLAHERLGPEAVYLVGAGAACAWLLVAATLRPPRQLTLHLLPMAELPAAALPGLRERLLAVPGVEEAVIALDEGVAHLKVDNHRVDWARLQAAATGA